MNRFACSDPAMAERLLARGRQSDPSLAPDERAHWNRCRSCRTAVRRIQRLSAAWRVLEPSPAELDGACGRFEARQARGRRPRLVTGSVAFAVLLAAVAASAAVRVLSAHLRVPAVLAVSTLDPQTAASRAPHRTAGPDSIAPAPAPAAAAPPAAAPAVSGRASDAPALPVPAADRLPEAASGRGVPPRASHAARRPRRFPLRGVLPGTDGRVDEPADPLDPQADARGGEDRSAPGREAPDRSPNERAPDPQPASRSPLPDRGGVETDTPTRAADSGSRASAPPLGPAGSRDSGYGAAVATGSETGVAPPSSPAATWSPADAWAAAAAAMRQGDRTRAELALNELVARGDARTRDAARLARAQLWVSEGRRGEARVELASLASRGATEFIRARASSELERSH